jgi:O-antigen ligase
MNLRLSSSFDIWISKLVCFFSFLVAFTIPFPIKVHTLSVTGACVFFLAIALKYKTITKDFFKSLLFLTATSFFLVLVVGLIYTPDLNLGRWELEKNITLIVFPFLAFQWQKFNIKLSWIFWAFTTGCVLVTAFGFIYILLLLESEEIQLVFSLGHSYYSNFIKLHPTYLSLYLIIILFFQIELFRTGKVSTTSAKIRSVILMMYVLYVLFLLRSRMAIPGFLIGMSFYLILLNPKRTKILLTLVFIFILGMLFILERNISTAIEKYGRNPQFALAARWKIWVSAYEGAKLSPFIGTGTGAAQEAIDEGYLKTGYDEGLDNIYNAHNQFLQLVCGNGIIGLLFFLLLIAALARSAYQNYHLLFIIFIILSFFYMLTESMLNTQKGIVFFNLFASCLYYLKND